MTHPQFKELLEEIQESYKDTIKFLNHTARNKGLTPDEFLLLEDNQTSLATQSLVTLFEDYTKQIVGKNRPCTSLCEDIDVCHHKYHEQFRQTIIKASKTILRGENR